MKRFDSVIKTVLAAFVVVLGIFLFPVNAFADNAKATVTVDGAYIRETPGTGGKIVASAMKNDVLEIVDTTTDSAGSTWYKVVVDAKSYGYVRSDLVSTSGTVPAASPATTTTTTATTATNTATTITTTATTTTTAAKAGTKTSAPKTGDAGVGIAFAMLAIAAGTAFAVRRRKEED